MLKYLNHIIYRIFCRQVKFHFRPCPATLPKTFTCRPSRLRIQHNSFLFHRGVTAVEARRLRTHQTDGYDHPVMYFCRQKRSPYPRFTRFLRTGMKRNLLTSARTPDEMMEKEFLALVISLDAR